MRFTRLTDTGESDRFETALIVPEHPDWVAGVPDVDALMERAPWRFTFAVEKGLVTWAYEFRGVTGIKLAPRAASKDKVPLQIAPERDRDLYGTDQGPKSNQPKKITASEDHTKGIGPIRGTFYVFDRDREILNKLGDSQLVQNFLDENGGVRVYRDSMRVYNYGEPGDDWLGLDLRRVNTPTRNISRNIIVGAIDLSLQHSDQLTEKPSQRYLKF